MTSRLRELKYRCVIGMSLIL